MSTNSRRGFLKQAGVAATFPWFSPAALHGAREESYAHEMPDMLLAHLSNRLNALAAKWDREREAIKTPAQLEARNSFVRQKLREMMHGFPKRAPLNPVVVAVHERDGYRVENVMFQSRPDFWVTGNVYVPTTGRGPFPGIISPCGHYPWARMEPEYQFAYMNMVKGGLVVLAFDPVGQGERRQYWNPQTGATEVASASTYEHSMPGQVQLLMGEDLTHYRVWDGMCAVDYLLTRPEVDKGKIGCAGHSGGGTLTKFISAIDERVKCVVVNEGGATNRWPSGYSPGSRLGPSDVEQNVFPAAIYGVDAHDQLVAVAPRPLLVTIEHFSPGFNRAMDRIRQRYELFDVAEKFGTEEAADPHSWTPKLRIATTDWFCRWFLGKRGPEVEPRFKAEAPETLYCTPNGSVRYSQQGQTVFSLMLRRQAELPPNRMLPENAAGAAAFRTEMAKEIRGLIHCDKPDHPLGVRNITTTPRNGYRIEKLQFLSEPGIYIPTWVFVPNAKNGRLPATLYLHEEGKETDGAEFGLLEELTRAGHLVVAVDVRGIGETEPPHPPGDRYGPFAHLFDAETAMSYMAWYMDESLFGMRVRDVMRSVDYALSRQDVAPGGLRVVGKGMGALWALYAAALDTRITSVLAEGGLDSYRSLARVDRYTHSANVFIRDVLLHFDLPHVAAAMAGRNLVLISPTGPMKNPVPMASAHRTYEWTAAAYKNAGAEGRFRITDGSFGLKMP
ncbi:MAG TPA: alpha/beta hydrolase family protein [Bryobacteraceae bacterium]|nr:alpha/beta hydrolase family protein [Bryobacteraceae bacterium]